MACSSPSTHSSPLPLCHLPARVGAAAGPGSLLLWQLSSSTVPRGWGWGGGPPCSSRGAAGQRVQCVLGWQLPRGGGRQDHDYGRVPGEWPALGMRARADDAGSLSPLLCSPPPPPLIPAFFLHSLQASLTSQVQGCTVYLLSQLPDSLPCKAVGVEGEAGRLTAMALVSWPGRSRGLGAAAAAASPLAGGGRSAGSTAALGVNMGPQILEGLIVGALLLVITLVGISCITTVATPDVLHSESMPAGKEY
jgi:hypothetical protein